MSEVANPRKTRGGESIEEELELAFLEATRAFRAATERLASRLLSDEGRKSLEACAMDRAFRFERLEALVAQGARPSGAARVMLDQVAQLDQAMMAAGGSLLEAIEQERQGIHRQRSAVRKHADRPRPEARLLAIRA